MKSITIEMRSTGATGQRCEERRGRMIWTISSQLRFHTALGAFYLGTLRAVSSAVLLWVCSKTNTANSFVIIKKTSFIFTAYYLFIYLELKMT